MKLCLSTFACLAFLSLSGFAAIGDVTNIQFKAGTDGLYSGSGVAGGSTLWNPFTGSSGTSMLDLPTSDGTASSVDFTATYMSRFGGATTSSTSASVLLRNGLYGTVSFTFSDLNPLDTFSLYVYVGNKAETVTTVSITTPGGGSQTPSPVMNQSSFAIDNNYVVFSGLTPDASRQLSGSVTSSWTALNGLQLQTTGIPEPGSAMLLGGGLLLLLGGKPMRRNAQSQI